MSLVRSFSSLPIPIPMSSNNNKMSFMDTGNDTPFTNEKDKLNNTESTNNLDNTESTNNLDNEDKLDNEDEMLKSDNEDEKAVFNNCNKTCIPIKSDIETRKKKVKYIKFEINSYNEEISKKKRKICDLEEEMYNIRNIRKKAYDELYNVCPHDWVRERERIPYGEYYNICKICNMIQ